MAAKLPPSPVFPLLRLIGTIEGFKVFEAACIYIKNTFKKLKLQKVMGKYVYFWLMSFYETQQILVPCNNDNKISNFVMKRYVS